VAAANVLALMAPDPVGGVYNIASGQRRTLWEMACSLHAGFSDAPAPVVTGQYRLGDVRHVTASPAKARQRLGFQAEVDFEVGMAQFAHDPLREG
jgi:dTDP-L-rhamnose 4-epimerase